jgi:hypothetical protein
MRLFGLVGVLILGTAVVVAVLALNSHHVKVVHVVVQARQPSSPVIATPPTRSTQPSLPPASAGTNGSFRPPRQSDTLLASGARASFERLRASLPGQINLALAPVGQGSTAVLGADLPAHGWSTTKVPVLTALLHARGAQGLTSAEQAWAEQAITASDNQSILNLFGDLEHLEGGLDGASTYVQELFRASGDANTVVATGSPPPGAVTTFGQTAWAPGDAVKFFRALALGCLIPGGQSSYVLGLMQRIVPSESWGLGSGGFNVPVAFKGGWGPESGGYLVRQSGIIDPGSPRGVAVSIVAYPPASGDSFSIGTQMVTRAAQWLRGQLLLRSRPMGSCTG